MENGGERWGTLSPRPLSDEGREPERQSNRVGRDNPWRTEPSRPTRVPVRNPAATVRRLSEAKAEGPKR